MMRTTTVAALAFIISAAAIPAAAQDAAAPPSAGRPLIIERIPSAFVVAPEYKMTNLDGDMAQLAGAYAGRMIDQTLLIGGAVYWLANNSSDFKMTYGGVIVGWSSPAGAHVRFGARGLAGVGTATLGRDVTLLRGTSLARFGGRAPRPSVAPPTTVRVLAQDDFAFAEPQADVVIRLNDRVGVTGSAGYRFTGFEDALRDRLDGVTGSVGVQLTW